MKTIILAAGKGTRMRPLTYGIPKPLLPIKGAPLIDLIVKSVDECSDQIIVAIPGNTDDSSKLHGKLIKTYLSNVYGRKISTLPTRQMETGGDLRYVLERSGITEGPVLVVYGDNLTFFDIRKMIHYHNECRSKLKTSATVLLFEAPKKEASRFGIAKVRKTGKLVIIEKFLEKPANPVSNLANGGYYILEVRDILKMLPDGKAKIEETVFPALADKQKLAGFITKLPYWIDVSTIEAYEKANRLAHKGLIIPPPK